MKYTTVFCLLPLLASSFNITYPNTNAVVDLSKSWNITWTSESSDPEYIRISLMQIGVPAPSHLYVVASNVSTSKHKFDVPANNVSLPSNITGESLNGWTFNVNALNTSSPFPYLASGDVFALSRGNTTGSETTSASGSPARTSSVSAATTTSMSTTSSGMAQPVIGNGGGNAVIAVLGAVAAVLL